MRCQAFENLVSDVARGDLVEAHELIQAQEHAVECPSCDQRLENQNSLSLGLRNLAIADADLSAPGRVEAELVSMFRAISTEKAAKNVVVLETAKPKRLLSWPIAVAAAIVAAILAGGLVEIYFHKAESVERNQVSSNPLITPSVSGTPERSDRLNNTTSGVSGSDVLVSNRPVPTASPRKPRMIKAAIKVPEVKSAATNSTMRPDPQAEVATDFFPVSYSSSLMPITSGRVVRVELPRTALASYGLPMNMSQSNGMVKADVVMDESGSARAIRFVR